MKKILFILVLLFATALLDTSLCENTLLNETGIPYFTISAEELPSILNKFSDSEIVIDESYNLDTPDYGIIVDDILLEIIWEGGFYRTNYWIESEQECSKELLNTIVSNMIKKYGDGVPLFTSYRNPEEIELYEAKEYFRLFTNSNRVFGLKWIVENGVFAVTSLSSSPPSIVCSWSEDIGKSKIESVAPNLIFWSKQEYFLQDPPFYITEISNKAVYGIVEFLDAERPIRVDFDYSGRLCRSEVYLSGIEYDKLIPCLQERDEAWEFTWFKDHSHWITPENEFMSEWLAYSAGKYVYKEVEFCEGLAITHQSYFNKENTEVHSLIFEPAVIYEANLLKQSE